MRFSVFLLLPLLAVAHAKPSPRGSRGGAAQMAGPMDCETMDSAVFYSTKNTTGKVRGMYACRVNVKLTCYTTGSEVDGNQYWDKTADGHYISEAFFNGTQCVYQLPQC
ncbi:hypothetical protein K440DRAFT_637208 [Wilcoxina mikolae CBS 423.85]|nr:hypothetical protein K440DRAFT_637208 [Wilcoxina mikolae CBS 423.85]